MAMPIESCPKAEHKIRLSCRVASSFLFRIEERRLGEDRRREDRHVTVDEVCAAHHPTPKRAYDTGATTAKTRCLSRSCLWMFVLSMVPTGAWADSSCPSPPPYALLRQDENYSYLHDVRCRRDSLDPIKFIPLSIFRRQ